MDRNHALYPLSYRDPFYTLACAKASKGHPPLKALDDKQVIDTIIACHPKPWHRMATPKLGHKDERRVELQGHIQ